MGRVGTKTVNGWNAVVLENDLLRVSVLPDKGADIYEITHLASGVDVLWKRADGLRSPGSSPRPNDAHPEAFMQQYEGVWQELFPNTGGSATYREQRIPMHGEVALLPWTFTVEQGEGAEIAVRFEVHCQQTPFHLARTMRLRDGAGVLAIEERVTNTGDQCEEFVWGHHCVVGPPLLEAGARLDAPARLFFTPAAGYEDGAIRLQPGQEGVWPFARTLDGERVDLSIIPAPDVHSHDDCLLTDLQDGSVAVTNERLGLRFRLALGRGAVRVDHRVATLRRFERAAAGRCLRARHRAMDIRGKS